MPRVTFVQSDGRQTTIEASEGMSVMQVAINNGIPGIVAECGGSAACATCKVEPDAAWAARLPPPDANERSLLDETFPNERLSCQIKVCAATDGLTVHVPASQYR